MKINEKIEEIQSKLIKTVIEASSYSKEEAVRRLQQLGLDQESATKLLLAYREAESAKNTAKDVWNTALNSRSGVDFSTDISKYQQQETEAREHFDAVKAECALQIVINTIEPSEINEEILNILYEQGIQESQITNPALKITFHYYSESRSKDIQRTQDLGKVREYSSRVGSQITQLQNQLEEAKSENRALRSSNTSLKTAYENLQAKFQERIALDEKYYQAARAEIKTLKDKLKQIQERGIFKVIGDKLTGLFGSKTEKLPETTPEIPETLLPNKSKKLGMQEFDEAEIFFMSREKNANHKDIKHKETSGEVQEP